MSRFHQFGRIRHFQFHHVAGCERARFQLAHPVRRMNAQNVLVARDLRAQEILGYSYVFTEQHFVDQTEFLRRKDVRAEIEIVAFVIDQFERKHGIGRS